MIQVIRTSILLFALVCIICNSSVYTQEKESQLPGSSKEKDITLTIHLRGVYESKISLMPMSGKQALQATIFKDGVKNGSTATLQIPRADLPGEFVLRFDYKEKESSTPYPSEKRMIINMQDLELWVSPVYCNNSDSTRYQEGELENTAFEMFMSENNKQKEMLGLLQQFLLNYDDNSSDFYKEGITEYEKRRIVHNQWITEQTQKYKKLFVSTKFGFQLIPAINWEGTEPERKQSLMDHYFDIIDLNDPLLVKTTELTDWMDSYVNLYGELATSIELRDSLFTLAGKRAIEQAKLGHPKVYGWMVDYFFKGYESFDIQKGTAMLEPYINDPNCLTSKRQAIEKRLEGMETLIPGSLAPDFSFTDESGNVVTFHKYPVKKPYKLVLFWGADCSHCAELVNSLYPWYQKAENTNKLDIFAISTDDTEAERKVWQQATTRFSGWKHIPTKGGVNSTEANSYFILATPVMILVDAKTNLIIAQPGTIAQLTDALK